MLLTFRNSTGVWGYNTPIENAESYTYWYTQESEYSYETGRSIITFTAYMTKAQSPRKPSTPCP